MLNPRLMSAKDTALDDLKARILKMELRPGTALEEAPLCAAYGLSRTPMREVFQKLAAAGFITLAPGRGAEVSQIELARLRQFFASAPLLHALVARQAAESCDEAGLYTLRNAQANVRKARVARNAAAMALADFGFHVALCAIADNPYLGPSLERLLIDQTRMSHRFYAGTTPDDSRRFERAMDEHDRIIEACARGDAGRAVNVAMAHWDTLRGLIETYVHPEPLVDEAGLLDDLR